MPSYLIPFIQTGIANSANTSNTANFANYAGNVTVSSQPNITSLGTLTSLSVNGAITVTGISNLNAINANGNVNFTGSNISLGSVSNLHISGGNNGYFLQTDGTGNLTWAAGGNGSGNGTVAGANTQIQYNNAGNFGATAGFTFNSSTSNMAVPNWINSGQQNGNAYLVGWDQNNIPTTSLFIGKIQGRSSNALLRDNFKPIFVGIDYDMYSFGIIGGNINNSSYSSIFDSNNRPGLPYVQLSSLYPVTIPIVRNTAGNSQVAVYLSNSLSSTVNIISVGNIDNGGMRNIIVGTSQSSNVFTQAIISTNNNETNLYIYLAKNDSNLANATWDTYTVNTTANYHPTSGKLVQQGFISGNTVQNSKILCILNANNFANTSRYQILEYNPNSNILTSVNDAVIGTANNYARFSKDGNLLFSAYPGIGLGKVATFTFNTSNNTLSTSEYNLPTVTPNATVSFAYDAQRIANIIYLSCYDNSNTASNTYWAIGNIVNSNISWSTYISNSVPTSIDSFTSDTRGNATIFYGLKNNIFYRQGPNTNQWDRASGFLANATYSSPTYADSNLTNFISNSLSYFEIKTFNSNGNTTQNVVIWTQAVSSEDDYGIVNIANVAYNTFNGNNYIIETAAGAFILNYNGPNNNSGIYCNSGIYTSLGHSTEGSSWGGPTALFIKKV